jgi:hypothetical protein
MVGANHAIHAKNMPFCTSEATFFTYKVISIPFQATLYCLRSNYFRDSSIIYHQQKHLQATFFLLYSKYFQTISNFKPYPSNILITTMCNLEPIQGKYSSYFHANS